MPTLDDLARACAITRKYLTVILLVGSAATFALVPDKYAFPSLIFWVVLSAIVMIVAQQETRSVARRFGGALREFAYLPTPMDSIVDLLERQGVASDEIDTITLMSCDLQESLNYLFGHTPPGGGAFGDLLFAHPDIKATIYGRQNGPLRNANYPIEIKPIIKRRTDHTNLFTAKNGRAFVWYEPYHSVVNGSHCFTRGAYLIEVPEATRDKLLQDFYPSLLTDKSKRGVRFTMTQVAA
jgi:hypothetical protein